MKTQLKDVRELADSLLLLQDITTEAVVLDDQYIDELLALASDTSTQLDHFEHKMLFCESYDSADAVCDIHAGAGGAEARSWVKLLYQMYTSWATQENYQIAVVDSSADATGGYYHIDLTIKGLYAYGWLKTEGGIHRLSRQSPFGKTPKRHTSFANVSIVPYLPYSPSHAPILDKDTRVDTYRASGAGGQHRNVRDSAVRITHHPSGIVVRSHNQRSQHQNKVQALRILQSKLAALESAAHKTHIESLRQVYLSAAFGNHIRSYVLDPHKLIVDHRNGHKTFDVDKTLNGALRPLMKAQLFATYSYDSTEK